LKIETESRGGRTTIRLIGHFDSQHIEELTRHLQSHGATVVLDLKELTLVDLDVVRFLGVRELSGAEVVNCSQYIREWIDRERQFGEIG
jgi:anti-anti-sigma regulatory factor